MAGKPKDVGRDAVMTFRMPRELQTRLIEASKGRSVSEEMRRRLEASLTAEHVANDPKTRELLMGIAYVSSLLAEAETPWYASHDAWEQFSTAINILLISRQPPFGSAPPGSPEQQQVSEDAKARGVNMAYRTLGYLDAQRERGQS